MMIPRLCLPGRAARTALLALPLLLTTGCAAPSAGGGESGSATDHAEAPTAASTAPASPAPTPPGGSTPEPSSAPPRTVSINTSGDLLWNETLYESARQADGGFDFGPQLASVRPFLAEADLAICHQEVPIAEPEGPYTGWPRFRAPQETVEAIAEAGFDVCTTASNHTNDDGWDGLVRTLDTLDRHGIEHTGSWRTAAAAQQPDLFTTPEGVVVGVVSQTYGLNGIAWEPGREWSVDTLDSAEAVARAREARAAGADVVIFHMHAGYEYTHEPHHVQEAMAEEVTASGEFDLVIGQHPHWVQPIDRVNDTWVVYSTGNLMAFMPGEAPGTHDGAMVQVDFTEGRDGDFEATALTWAPTYITTPWNDPSEGPRVLVVPDELEQADPALRERLLASAARTREVITSRVKDGITERTSADR